MSTSGTYIPERAKGIPFTDDEVSEIENTHDTHFNSTAKILTILKTQPTGGDKGIFAGGGTLTTAISNIESVTISTLGNSETFGNLTGNRLLMGGTSNGAYSRGIFFGGDLSNLNGVNRTNIIEYITITSPGNSQDFGDISTNRDKMEGVSNSTEDRGLCIGGHIGSSSGVNIIEYVTISTSGNSQDFGDLTIALLGVSGSSNGINNRAVCAGGLVGGSSSTNIINYITISTIGNAVDFGDLTVATRYSGGTSNGINDRGVWGGGTGGTRQNVIDYVTISTLGDASDFGDLTQGRTYVGSTSNKTDERSLFAGGDDSGNNVIDYITISTTSDATDFGDMSTARSGVSMVSNSM